METTPVSPSLAGKKIVFAITKSNWGGAQAYVSVLATQARDAGAEVVCMAGVSTSTATNNARLFSELEKEAIRTIPLQSIQRDIGIMSDWHALQEIISVLRREKPDVLHLNSSKMGVLGAIDGRISHVPKIVFTSHGWPYLEQRSPLWKLMAFGGAWLTTFLSTDVIAVSEYDLRTAPVFFSRKKVVHIPNSIQDFQLETSEEARAFFIARNPALAAYSSWLLMNAELHPNKGIATAIRALAELFEEHSDLALVVCGEGQDHHALQELADSLGVASRVFLLGFVDNAKAHLRAGTIYLMPSRKEGLPLALIEAAHASLPVIATNVGGIPEIIEDQKTGLFMPRDNTQILAKAIDYVLKNPEMAKNMGRSLNQKVRTDFSLQTMISKTLSLYAD